MPAASPGRWLDLSLNVAAGEIYGLVGPDGAGKTTTMRLLCGALRPDPGKQDAAPEISITGIDLLRHTDPARARLGYLAQRFSMYEDLTVLENLRFFAEVRGLKAAEWQPRCLEILEFVGLGDYTGRRAGQLSGGMKQKLGLAAALVHRPAGAAARRAHHRRRSRHPPGFLAVAHPPGRR